MSSVHPSPLAPKSNTLKTMEDAGAAMSPPFFGGSVGGVCGGDSGGDGG